MPIKVRAFLPCSGIVRLLLICFVAIGLAASACSKGGGSGSPPAEGAGRGGGRAAGRGGGGPVPVVTTHALQKPVPVTIPAVGTAEPLATVQIRAQVTGQLSAVHFSEGQEVKKGQPLFTIDPRPFEAALAQAQAVLSRDTATQQNAQQQAARYEDLFKRGLIPRDQYETQRASNQSLQATLE